MIGIKRGSVDDRLQDARVRSAFCRHHYPEADMTHRAIRQEIDYLKRMKK